MKTIYQNEALGIRLVLRSFVVKNCEKGLYFNFSELGNNILVNQPPREKREAQFFCQPTTSGETRDVKDLGQPTTSRGARGLMSIGQPTTSINASGLMYLSQANTSSEARSSRGFGQPITSSEV